VGSKAEDGEDVKVTVVVVDDVDRCLGSVIAKLRAIVDGSDATSDSRHEVLEMLRRLDNYASLSLSSSVITFKASKHLVEILSLITKLTGLTRSSLLRAAILYLAVSLVGWESFEKMCRGHV